MSFDFHTTRNIDVIGGGIDLIGRAVESSRPVKLRIRNSDTPVILDLEVYQYVKQFNWELNRGENPHVLCRFKDSSLFGKKYVRLSHLVLELVNLPKTEPVRVIHLNGNIFDFRRSNLKRVLSEPFTYEKANFEGAIKFTVSRTDNPAIVDEEDLEKVNTFKWEALLKRNKEPYPGTHLRHNKTSGRKYLKLTHVILGITEKYTARIEHLNGNLFDCRKKNLKISDSYGRPKKSSIYRSASFSLHITFSKQKSLYDLFAVYQRVHVSIKKFKSLDTANHWKNILKSNFILSSEALSVDGFKKEIRNAAYTLAAANGICDESYAPLKQWTADEISALETVFDSGDISEIQNSLPGRTPGAIIRKALLLETDKSIPGFLYTEQKLRRFVNSYPEELQPTAEVLFQLNQEILNQKKIRRGTRQASREE